MATTINQDNDPTATSRKQDHIELAFQSQVNAQQLDQRFYYEPLLAAHPVGGSLGKFPFAGRSLRTPIWVSSMTGGTGIAKVINHNLARACGEFGMGMGLGSCRQLLYSDDHLPDFDVRSIMGPDCPLYANLGIAQLEKLLESKEEDRIRILLDKLGADGLIIHVNPLQEAMQPEGDVFKRPPIETIQEILTLFDCKIIVKEVGQGFGRESLRQLLLLPLEAVEFAAAGGTNFAKLELMRSDPVKQQIFEQLTKVGHSAEDMVEMTNTLVADLGDQCKVSNLIISGGIQSFLDGYYLIQKSKIPAIYGQASAFLEHARGDYETLRLYIMAQIKGLEIAFAYLKLKAPR